MDLCLDGRGRCWVIHICNDIDYTIIGGRDVLNYTTQRPDGSIFQNPIGLKMLQERLGRRDGLYKALYGNVIESFKNDDPNETSNTDNSSNNAGGTSTQGPVRLELGNGAVQTYGDNR